MGSDPSAVQLGVRNVRVITKDGEPVVIVVSDDEAMLERLVREVEAFFDHD